MSHAAEVSELIQLTEQALQDPGPRQDPATYVNLLQALLALEGVAVWGDRLDGLISEEYEVPCPHCDAENFVAFGKYGHFTTLDDMYVTKPVERIPLLPKQPRDLAPLGRRLHTRAVTDGHPDLADKLTYVFGTAQCANCGTLFQVDQAIAAAR